MPIVWMRKLGFKHIIQSLTPTIKFGSDLKVHDPKYSILGMEEAWQWGCLAISGLGCFDFD